MDQIMKRLTNLPGILVTAISCLWTTNAKADALAYVTSEKDNAVAVLGLADMKVQATIATCKRPRHIQRSIDGRLLLVSCGDDSGADMIDIATRKSVGRLPMAEGSEMFDLSPDGKTLYVSNEDDAELNVLDLVTKKKRAAVKVGKEPEGVKVSADGKTVYVTSEISNMVHVIDASTLKVVKNIPVGKRPRRFAISPDGAELWVTNELDASVTIISTRNHTVLGTINFEVKGARTADITPVGILMSRDGKRAFVALGRANHVAFVDTATRKVVNLVLAGKRAWGLGLTADESKLLVVNGLSDDMTVVDVKSAKAITTIPMGRVPHSVVVID
jgi:PQQ-dependent catabolism-associated beta-propeller protein